MGTEPAPAEPEHPVADLEGGDPTADPLDDSRKLTPENRHPWSEQPGEEPIDKGLAARKAQSVRFTVVARTLTSTSLSLGVGLSTSVMRTTSGGP
jgi:hypothetical protein